MEQDNGFVKIYRSITKWEWYQDGPTFKVFFHLLLVANHKQRNHRGTPIKRGQHVTSYKKLANECGLSIQQVRTALKNLRLTGEITHESTRKGSVITIVNYSTYQTNNTPPNRKTTKNQQTSNKASTTNKNEKNVKNEKNKTVGVADISPSAFLDKDPDELTPEERAAKIAYLRR